MGSGAAHPSLLPAPWTDATLQPLHGQRWSAPAQLNLNPEGAAVVGLSSEGHLFPRCLHSLRTLSGQSSRPSEKGVPSICMEQAHDSVTRGARSAPGL